MAFLNNGADLAAGQGLRSAMATAARFADIDGGFIPFVTIIGGTQRIDTGSHVNVTGVSALTGVAKSVDLGQVKLLGGAFVEFGASHIKTHNDFDSGTINGKGKARYVGGGLMSRLDVSDTMLAGLYAEASLRAGGLDTDWHSNDMVDVVSGKRAQYDITTPYYGAHFGLGYVWQPADKWSIDFYGKYLWTHMNGKHTYVADDPYHFKAMDSHRLRVGTRAHFEFTKQSSIYAGAAWEREFDGDARATAYGFDTPSPSLKGNTGVFDLGVSFSPDAAPDLTLEVGGSAFTGTRRGVSGNFMLKYKF